MIELPLKLKYKVLLTDVHVSFTVGLEVKSSIFQSSLHHPN